MAGAWTGEDGLPVEYPAALLAAIFAIPGADALGADRAEFFARLIAGAAVAGRDLERPANLIASARAADKSLARLHDICAMLGDHLEKLRRPAVEALAREGASVATLALLVREAQEAARCAYGGTDAPPHTCGRPRAIEAAEITEACAVVFEAVSGRRVTIIRDVLSHEARGPWIDFLAAAFAACGVVASPEAQAKALMEKKRPRAAD